MMESLLGTVGLAAVWWSEDTFCNKKLLPGHSARASRTMWNSILAVTEESFNTWVDSLCRQQKDSGQDTSGRACALVFFLVLGFEAGL